MLGSVLLGACANIIGISSYEVDPALDPDTSQGGTGAEAGASDGGSGVTPGGGHAGVTEAGADTAGGESGASAGGAGGECEPADCDDEIPCTVDTCEGETCVHTPDNTACDADPDECVACQVGIGCVATPPTQVELLLNGGLDELLKIWREVVLDHPDQGTIISSYLLAQSPDNTAYFKGLLDPAANEPDQGYAEIYQTVTIPEGTKQLRATGYYEVFPGTYAVAEDDLTVGLYELGSTAPALLFHTWSGSGGVVDPWVRFDYLASPTQLTAILGLDVTFTIFSYTWDSEFYVDTLSLEASVCQ